MHRKGHLQNVGRATLESPSPPLRSNLSLRSDGTCSSRGSIPLKPLEKGSQNASAGSIFGRAHKVHQPAASAPKTSIPLRSPISESSLSRGASRPNSSHTSLSHTSVNSTPERKNPQQRGSVRDPATNGAPRNSGSEVETTRLTTEAGAKHGSSRIPFCSKTTSESIGKNGKQLSIREQRDIVQKALSSGRVFSNKDPKKSKPMTRERGEGNNASSARNSISGSGSNSTAIPGFKSGASAEAKRSGIQNPRQRKPVVVAEAPARKEPESDPFEEDDVEYSWPPKPSLGERSRQPPMSTPPTYEPSTQTSPRTSASESMEVGHGVDGVLPHKLFEIPTSFFDEPPATSSRNVGGVTACAIKSGVDDISIQWARRQFQSRTPLKLPFKVIQVMKDRPLFQFSVLPATSQRVVSAWVRGECSGDMVALTLLNRPAFFLEDKEAEMMLNALATTPDSLCREIYSAKLYQEVLSSELEIRFLEQEDGELCSGLWREVVRQSLDCPITGFGTDALRKELSGNPPRAATERNAFIGRYIYELLQIKRDLLEGSFDSAYTVLGLSPDATDEQVRKAYRKLCLKHHPDKGGDPAQFLAVQRAFHTIKEMRKPEQEENESAREDEPTMTKKKESCSSTTTVSTEASVDTCPGEGKKYDKEDGARGAEESKQVKMPHPLTEKLRETLEEVRAVRAAAQTSVVAKQTIEALGKTHTLSAVQEATKAAQSAIEDALVVIADGLGERVAKVVMSAARACIELSENDAATALVVQEGMTMLIKSKSLSQSSRSLKPVQKEIQLVLETLNSNLMIGNMLGTMDAETAKMSLRLVAEASRRAQSALKNVLDISESLEVCIGTALLHSQSINTAPTGSSSDDDDDCDDAENVNPDLGTSDSHPKRETSNSQRQEPAKKMCEPQTTTEKIESIAADQRSLLKRLLEEIELLRRPLSADGLVMAMRIVAESLVSQVTFSLDYPFDVPSAALKAVLHHPEGRQRVTALLDEMKKLEMPIPESLASLL